MRRGACGLCGNQADLHDSHLLPSSIFKMMKLKSARNPNPIAVRPGVAVITSNEICQHFLCGLCEERLNNGGERWIVRNCGSEREFVRRCHFTRLVSYCELR
jgi:hypothetical protein